MKIKLWGTRGVNATPERNTCIFGGNTSCIQVIASNGDELLIDAGTGIIRRGKEAAPTHKQRYHILITHTHLDHVAGFVFFLPIHFPDSHITIYAPEGTEKGLMHIFESLFQEQYSPLRSMVNVSARIDFEEWKPGQIYEIDDFIISTASTYHTTNTLAYRIEVDGVSLSYVTDHDAKEGSTNDYLLELIRDSNLLVHDAEFSEEEYIRHSVFGHSSFDMACRNAVLSGSKRLLLFHHDPGHDDKYLEDKEIYYKDRFKDHFPLGFAREGSVIEVD